MKNISRSLPKNLKNLLNTCQTRCERVTKKQWIVIAIVVLGLLIVWLSGGSKKDPELTLQEKYPELSGPDIKAMGVREKAQIAAEMIRITSPSEGSTIASPLVITGFARGGWFSEGTFAIELRENDGDIIATVNAQAQDEWMTEEYVPFTATITYPPRTAGEPAKIVLHNANPSGEADKALEYGYWVSF